MTLVALKDLFNGFFVVEEEEDEPNTPSEPEQTNQRQQQAQSQNNYSQEDADYTETRRSLKSVPKKQKASRLSQSQSERKYQMNNTARNNRNVVNMNNEEMLEPQMQDSSKMCLFEPRVFSDTQDIADELKNRRATLVNLQRIDKVSAKRIVDFLSGTVYAIGGDIQRVGSDIFLCTPDNVEVAGTITDQVEYTDYQHE